MTITMRDWGWVAGFIEGEGSFSISGVNPRVSVTQVELEPLEKLVGFFGGKIYPKKPAGYGKKQCYVWVLAGEHGIALMMTIYPLMCVRRQGQIRACIVSWKSRASMRGAGHYKATVSDEQALEAMRHVRSGKSMEVVAESIGVTRHALSLWMRGKKRPTLATMLAKEGVPTRYVYNGGRGEPRYLSDEVILAAIRKVRSGRPVGKVAMDIKVSSSVVSLWCSGKNRPYLLAQVLEEERESLEEVR